jgi:hypothetical protein
MSSPTAPAGHCVASRSICWRLSNKGGGGGAGWARPHVGHATARLQARWKTYARRPPKAASHIAVAERNCRRHLAPRGRRQLPSAPSSPRCDRPGHAGRSQRAAAWIEELTPLRIRTSSYLPGE